MAQTIGDLDLTPPDEYADLQTWLARNFGIVLDVHLASGGVDSVFGRSGDVIALLADYNSFFLTPAEGDASYLGIADIAANSQLLDGIDSLGFLLVGGTAVNSQLLDGIDSTGFLLVGAKAADSELLDGINSTGFLLVGAKAADSELLDGVDSLNFCRSDVADILVGAMTFNEIIASDKGISFPATQVTSADANTQDDYEEGTFTPIMTDSSANAGTHSVQEGHYTKIGNMVFCTIHILLTSLASMAGALRIIGLPFTSNSTANSDATFVAGRGGGMSVNVKENVTGTVPPNTTHMLCRLWDATQGSTLLQEDEMTNTGRLILSGFYRV